MGMASSQARLLNLTSRMHQIEYKAAKIEAEKLQMANESRRAYLEYQNALERTKIQYKSLTTDGSATFLDATLAILENGAIPGYNQGVTSPKSFLLQNARTGEIYVTEALANQYPYMKEPIEDPGTLDDYLHENGIDPEPIYETVPDYDNVISIESYPKNHSEQGSNILTIPSKGEIIQNVLLLWTVMGKPSSGLGLESKILRINDNTLLALINSYATGSLDYYSSGSTGGVSRGYDYLLDAVNGRYSTYEYEQYDNLDIIQQSMGNPVVIYGTKQEQTGLEYVKDENYYNYYNEWQTKKAAYDSGYHFVVVDDELANNKDFLNNHLTTNQSILIDWELYSKREDCSETSVATNTFFQEVDDEKELRKAEAKYEADMRRIDYKDRKFDYDLAALDAERNAIKSEMETLKTVTKDNVDRTFKLFG